MKWSCIIPITAIMLYAQAQAQDVDTNTVPAPSAEAPAPRANEAAQTSKKPFTPSYGRFDISILYPPSQKTEYFEKIMLFERDGLTGADIRSDERNQLEALDGNQVEEDPDVQFPNYALHSLLYHNPRLWSVHMNGKTITPQNNKRSNELYVASISHKAARFIWRPADANLIAKLADKRNHSMKPLPEELTHREATQHAKPRFFPAESIISFTLEPNQFFASGYMKVLEGKGTILPAFTTSSTPQEQPEKEQEATTKSPDPLLQDVKNIFQDNTPAGEVVDDLLKQLPETERDYLLKRAERTSLKERFMKIIKNK